MPFGVAEFDPGEISFVHHDRAFRRYDPPQTHTTSVHPGLAARVARRSRWVANEHFAPAALVVIADAGRPRIGDGLRRSARPPSFNSNTSGLKALVSGWGRRVEAAAMPRCWRRSP